MTRSAISTRFFAAALLSVVALAGASCGDVARSGRAPVQLVIDVLEGASGATPDEYSTTTLSDVQTLVEQQINGQTVRVPTIFNDLGRATFRMTFKNPAVVTGPSTLHEITLTRYRVSFSRSDGRNTPGVDVPYGFDGAFTSTIPAGGTATVSFDLVRHQLKVEPPLRNLVNGGGPRFISTIAEITFWGRDQTGNEVMAVGMLNVNFGDWADPN
jgi:hypothetical protein